MPFIIKTNEEDWRFFRITDSVVYYFISGAQHPKTDVGGTSHVMTIITSQSEPHTVFQILLSICL
jgi:hypothetical protein